MPYHSRAVKPLALALYLLTIMLLPMPWLTDPSSILAASKSRLKGHVMLTSWSQKRGRIAPNPLPFRQYNPSFHQGNLQGVNSSCSFALVVSRQANDDVSWISDHLPHIDHYIYTADLANGTLHNPLNKGHEAMVYLTHIIGNYGNLADVNVFMHKDRFTFHNEDLLGFDSVKMINRLRGVHVINNGYTNLQCAWLKSCPSWLNSSEVLPNMERQEQVYLARAWDELFPSEGLPDMLAAPCCAQYAVSKDRIAAIPLAKFIYIRDWLMKTPLTDYISGRLWEYLWHYLFTGEYIRCPAESDCLCDVYGICFSGEEGLKTYRQLHLTKEGLQKELSMLERKNQKILDVHRRNASASEAVMSLSSQSPEYLRRQIMALEEQEKQSYAAAVLRGDSTDKSSPLL